MSNHYSAAYLRFPGDDARLDFTDLYAFSSPDDAAKTILIMDVNPYTTGISAMPPFLMRPGFHPDGVYRINVDSDGDAQADAAFSARFAWLTNGKVGPTGLKPHDDLLAEFPFLGPPNRYTAG
jgi:hypothetical protein